MKKFIIIFFVFLISCQEEKKEFKQISENIEFKYVQFGEGEKPLPDEIIQVLLMVTNENNDTLHYVPDYNYFLEFGNNPIDSAIRRFNVGDSLIFRTTAKQFSSYLKFYEVLQLDKENILFHVRLVNTFSREEAQDEKNKEFSARELEEQVNLKKYLANETDSIQYLDGVYRIIQLRTNSTPIKYGSEVSIHYRGSFLNGYVFDNTYEKSITPSFTFGQEYQMIDGLQTALSGMKEGERVKIILPSRHAFGEEGSLAGIVPPYTAVIYEVNIIKVIN